MSGHKGRLIDFLKEDMAAFSDAEIGAAARVVHAGCRKVFTQYFDIEPHNSYIGGFANDGWIGGFCWIFIVLSTTFVGFRLIFVQSPYQRLAQVAWPALFVLFLQGFQIDIDHWRQVFLLCGMIWGFEAARIRWREREQRVVEQPSPLKASETYA